MKALTFIEIDVPNFDAERQAGFANAPYLRRGGGLTGAADGKQLTFAAWVYVTAGLGARLISSVTTLGGGTPGTRCVLSAAANRFSIAGMNAAGVQICSIESSPLPFGRWVHVMGSVNLSDPAKRQLYVNGVADLASVNTYTDDTMDFTMADWGIGGYPNGASLLNGAIGDLWFQPGLYLDLAQESNRRKFLSADGNPVDLGADGSGPTGTPPLVFLSGALASWHTNKGTGGGFTLQGTLGEFEALPCSYRFTYPCSYAPAEIEAIPSLATIGFTPATISLGSNLGMRASLAAKFSDHKHIFNGEAFASGSFWGKWRARYGTRLQGRALRWIQGLEGQSLAQMETRHFVIDATEGPTLDGSYTIVAKDILKLADGDRAQAPRPSSGFLVAAIDNNDTSASLSPVGIGNAEYPASGHVALGGEEICSFTRSGDVLTLTRGQLGTTAVAHDAGVRAQRVLRYVGEDPANIIHDLLVTYAGIDPETIPLPSWLVETDSYLQQNYTANIAEPTDVKKLISELIEQAALVVWWEPLTQLIRLQVLRAIPTTAQIYSPENVLEGSLGIKEQPAARVSQVFTYFGQRNPLEPIDQENNYRSAALTVDPEAELAYGTPAIKKIFSRWIPFGARTVALRLNDLVLGRFRDPPRRFNFNLFRYNNDVQPELGGGYRLAAWPIQNADGTPGNAPIQITRLNPLSDRYELEAEEMLFVNLDPADLVNRVVIIDAAIFNLNLRELHDAIYPDPDPEAVPAESVRFIIEANVIVGSASSTIPAIDVGSWPPGYPVSIEIYGRLQGRGGDGGRGSNSSADGLPGQPGGTALYTRFPVDVTIFAAGSIWGGGGGGGGMNRQQESGNLSGWGGGGGAGVLGGNAGQSFRADDEDEDAPTAGTATAGGQGGGPTGIKFPGPIPVVSGAGGDPGQAGGQGIGTGGESNNPGGAGGRAIDGISFVTLDNQAGSNSIKGATVN